MEQDIILDSCSVSLYKIGRDNSSRSNLFQVFIDTGQIIRYFLKKEYKSKDIIYIHTPSYYGFFRSVPYIIFSKILSNGKIVLHIHGGEFDVFFGKSSKISRKKIKFAISS